MALEISGSAILNKLKGVLSPKEEPLVGIDIGLSAVKVAEVSGDDKSQNYTLVNYASIPLSEGAIIEDEIQKEDEIVDAIKQAFEKSAIKGKNVCLGINGPNTIARRLQVSGGSHEEIEDQIIWESEQYLPFDIEKCVTSFHIFGKNEGGGVDVLLAAALKDTVKNFTALAEKAGLKVKVVDLGMLALTNIFSLVSQEKINDPYKSWVVLDIGAQKTSFIVYRNGKILFSKEINAGGSMITEEIQRQMGVNYEQAEDLKIIGDGDGNIPEEIVEIIDDVTIKTFFSEIKKTMDFYVSSTSDDSLSGCFATGGMNLNPNFLSSLESATDMPITLINPFEKISYNPKKITEESLEAITYKGVQAIGLAMRKSA